MKLLFKNSGGGGFNSSTRTDQLMKQKIDTYHSLEVTDIIESLSMKLIYIFTNYILLLVLGNIPQSILQHLKWIMQKDLLGQDVFLIGPPGPLRRSLAMMYLVCFLFVLHHSM